MTRSTRTTGWWPGNSNGSGEAKLVGRREVEEAYARSRDGQPQHPSAADRDRIRRLATDAPALWHASTTIGADRRAVVRQMIERVTLSRPGASEVVDLVVRWRGATETRQVVRQGTHCYGQLADVDRLRDRLRALRGQGRTTREIAATLNAEGYHPSRGSSSTRTGWGICASRGG